MRADILLATYNGAAFLEEQLQSILKQSYSDWHLYIRDDHSSDGTTAIIQKYVESNSEKITWIKDDDQGLGASGNFSRLMEQSSAPYVLFCDQDDIWEPDKVELMVKAMHDVEDASGIVPLYVFSDLKMIDGAGNVIASSLWEKEGIDPKRTRLNQLLVQNVPYGCASMVNRELLEMATPVDPRALLHDHWLVLLAAAAGKVCAIDVIPVRHRIHDSNASRANNPIRMAREKSAVALLTNQNFNRYFNQLEEQALAVKERLLERNYSNVAYDVLDDFINLRDRGLLARKYLMIKRRYFKHSRVQSLKWLIKI